MVYLALQLYTVVFVPHPNNTPAHKSTDNLEVIYM